LKSGAGRDAAEPFPFEGDRKNVPILPRALPAFFSALLLALVATAFDAARADRARAQEVPPRSTASVAAREGARVNVRSEPAIRSGNVVGVARGGDKVTILATAERPPHDWYMIEAADKAYTGWIRGDLIRDVTAASTEPEAEAPASMPAEQTEAAAEPEKEWPPYESRRDWTRYMGDYYTAIRDCTRVSSSQPARALKAQPLNRGMINVLVEDASQRVWDCVIRDVGGTPLRFDPLISAWAFVRDPTDPVFVLRSAIPPRTDACTEVESFVNPVTGVAVGWIIHNVCGDGKAS